jgi:hypothetical protein
MEDNKNTEPKQPSESVPKEIIAVDETVVPESKAATVVKQIEQCEIPITSGTTNTKSQTSTMEVHHHGHVHEKKKWERIPLLIPDVVSG